jgi:N-acetylglucosamine kinase-like BadF-type ATPase
MYVLGVDTGGTRTRCVVVDGSLSMLGVGEAGPGNYRVAGTDGARDNVEAAIRAALANADLDESAHLVGGFGMGTLDTEDDRQIITEFLHEIDLVDEYHVTNDVVAAYYSFTAGEPGVVVIAGTGAMAYGRNESGGDARSSGWGWLFGDEGSGFDTARRGLRAASKAYDGRGDETELLGAAVDHFQLDSFEDVFTGVYGEIDHAKEIASFAEPVAEAAADGDEVAVAIVEDAGEELAIAAAVVIEELDLAPAPTVACQGGFGTAPVVADQFESRLTDRYPQTRFADPVANSVVGSVGYVAEQRDWDVTRADLAELDAELERLDAF